VAERRESSSLETLLLQDLKPDAHAGVVPPIHQTSLFTFDSFGEMRETLTGANGRYVYTRGRNPTVEAFEEKIALLEGAEDACAFSSGMAAIAAAVLSNVTAGDRIVCVRNVYPDAYRLMVRLLPRLGVTTEFVDGSDLAAVTSALAGGPDRRPARLLYLESPTTLLFDLQDIAALTAVARELRAVTVVDNSWATPLGQRPLTQGADLVLHSASKYLCGHSDVVAGVVAGGSERVAAIRDTELMLLGGKLSPFDAWLLLRGLRTLPLRIERHRHSARQVAEFLTGHPLVKRVRYPGLAAHHQAELFQRSFAGASGLLSFELAGDDLVEPFVDALRLFRIGVSWGGYESLVYPVLLSYLAGDEHAAARAFEVPRALIRLHVGLEDADDLIADLTRALGVLTKGGQRLEVS
jgi:cystathionine beta-lyase/cystathionine gamma-synthase